MIIKCPWCGPRDSSEFVYQGEGGRTRPDQSSTDQSAWNAYVYDRVNTAGDHDEIWQHAGGCRSHLKIIRNTMTHKVLSVVFTRDTQDQEKPA